MSTFRLALAQLNVTVGDLEGNREKIAGAIRLAEAWRADLVVMPELAICGYPPEDLLLKSQFIRENLRMLHSLKPLTRRVSAIVGFVDRDQQGRLYDAAAVLAGGRKVAVYHKQCLPNYGVFDEKRYFTPGDRPLVVSLRGIPVGVMICEDLWQEAPAKALAHAGARIAVNLSASPYHAGKLRERERIFAKRARKNNLAIADCNLVGGQDELVFDGASLMLDATGRRLAHGAPFQEDFLVADLNAMKLGRSRIRRHAVSIGKAASPRPALPWRHTVELNKLEEVYAALCLGLRDYVEKNGFETVVLGLSGGVDSALTAALAVDALGSDRVVGVVMPSRYSSKATQQDARRLAARLGMECLNLPIRSIVVAYQKALQPILGKTHAHSVEVTDQNIQARIRGNFLMALSNKFGWLVLTTGNKSEMATGYTTLYGDMAGGFAVLKDVPKTLVYELARYRNRKGKAIPPSIIRRVPTAELAPRQKDSDSLPPYPVLDRILKAYVEENRSLGELLLNGRLRPALVRRVIEMVDRAEYKRRQGPPGIKITPRAFGKDRRMPITNRYRHES